MNIYDSRDARKHIMLPKNQTLEAELVTAVVVVVVVRGRW